MADPGHFQDFMTRPMRDFDMGLSNSSLRKPLGGYHLVAPIRSPTVIWLWSNGQCAATAPHDGRSSEAMGWTVDSNSFLPIGRTKWFLHLKSAQVPITRSRTTTPIGILKQVIYMPCIPGSFCADKPQDQLLWMRKYICWGQPESERKNNPLPHLYPTGEEKSSPCQESNIPAHGFFGLTHCTWRLTNDPKDAPAAYRTGLLARCS